MKNILSLLIFFSAFLITDHAGLAYAQKRSKIKLDRITPPTAVDQAEFFFIEAEKYYILGDYEKALLHFEKAAKLDPLSGTIFYKIAETLSKSKQRKDLIQAAVNIETALSLQQDNPFFFLLAASIYTELSTFSKATQALETMIQTLGNTEKYLYQLGEVYLRDRKYNKALKTYNEAELTLGIAEQSSLPKYKIYIQRGNVKEAINEIQKLIRVFPDQEEYTLTLVKTYLDQQQFEKAITVLAAFVSQHPNADKATLQLITLYHDHGQIKEIHPLLENLITAPNISINQKTAVLQSYMDQRNQPGETIYQNDSLLVFITSLLDQLKRQYPHEPDVYVTGGYMYSILGQEKVAKRYYQKAIQKGSLRFTAWQNLLSLEAKEKQWDDLIINSEKALEIFPGQALFYYFSGYGYRQKKDYQQAIVMLEQAKKIATSDLQLTGLISQQLADIYHVQKKYDKSDKAYREALMADPENYALLSTYSYRLAERKDSLKTAEKMALKAVQSAPDNIHYLDTYAWVLFMRNHYQKALHIMEKIIKTKPLQPAFFDHYGDILFKMGNKQEALIQWEKAKSKGMNNEQLNQKLLRKTLD